MPTLPKISDPLPKCTYFFIWPDEKCWPYGTALYLYLFCNVSEWCSAYTEDFVLNKDRVQTEINKYMADFDKKAQEVG